MSASQTEQIEENTARAAEAALQPELGGEPVFAAVDEDAEAIPAEGEAETPERCRYIPIRKSILLRAALSKAALPDADRADMNEFARRLGLLFHVEFFAAREELKDLYIQFNPDQPGSDPLPESPEAKKTLFDKLRRSLVQGNYSQMSADELSAGASESGRVGAKVAIPTEVFERVEFHGRGRHKRGIKVPAWFGLRKKEVDSYIYDEVVFIAAVKSEVERKHLRRSRIRPGGIYIKLFRDIPRADMQTLYPNARVVMKIKDQLMLGVPALVGGIPILINILPAVLVLVAIAGAYLGLGGEVKGDTEKAIAAISGLAALGGFLMRQWVKYERQKLKYQQQVAENAYFNNINNNAGFFDYLIGASEDSEVKEAFLGYLFLHISDEPLTEEMLDQRIEAWLANEFDADVDFEIDDALDKLKRLGFVEEGADGILTPLPLKEALAKAEADWLELGKAPA